MAYIQVTSSELRTKAEELRGLNQRFTQEIENMLSHQNNLNSMWEGEAKEAFNQAFNQDKGKLDNFKNAIDAYIQALTTIAARYEDAEKKNFSIAGQRTY